jgi:hypothetical protein
MALLILKLDVHSKRPAHWKRCPPHILAGAYFDSYDNPPRILADYSAGCEPDAVLKTIRINIRCTGRDQMNAGRRE